jgi:DNA-binding MltR family transcriptional regulator
MDIEQFQAIEKQLAEQAEATHITNDNLVNLVQMMSTRESKNIAPTPLAPAPIPQLITM